MGNLPKRVKGYWYKYFGMGGVPKIPLIKIGVGITGKGNGLVNGTFISKRHVMVHVLLDLTSWPLKVEAKSDHNDVGKTTRLAQNGLLCSGRFERLNLIF